MYLFYWIGRFRKCKKHQIPKHCHAQRHGKNETAEMKSSVFITDKLWIKTAVPILVPLKVGNEHPCNDLPWIDRKSQLLRHIYKFSLNYELVKPLPCPDKNRSIPHTSNSLSIQPHVFGIWLSTSNQMPIFKKNSNSLCIPLRITTCKTLVSHVKRGKWFSPEIFSYK